MPSLFDWIDALSKPSDDPALKDLEDRMKALESLKRGDYIKDITPTPEETPFDKQLAELQKLRQDFDNYRAEYAAYKTAEEGRAKRDARKVAKKSIIGTLIVTIIGGLFLYYWPSIVSFFANLFQA